ncbi:MAG: hypothetical protein H7Z19_20860, partial [Chitinophagaceae bacterium]|nr:hypothetical protein [Rubrivivax sp.]
MLALGTLASAHAQTAARDANTGAWRAPTAAEAAELEALRDKSNLNRGVVTGTLNPKPVRQPDGSDYLESTEGDMNYSVLVVGANGRVARQCVPNATIAN